MNEERFSVQKGELQYFDDNGKLLKEEQIKHFLEEKKRQIIEKNKNRNIKFLTSNNIVKIKNIEELLYIVSRNINPNGDYLYDYCAIKYNDNDKDTKYYFDHEDIEKVYVKKSESKVR